MTAECWRWRPRWNRLASSASCFGSSACLQSSSSVLCQWNCSEAPSIGITATVYKTFVDFNVGIVSQQLVHHSVHHAVHLTRPASTGTTYIHHVPKKLSTWCLIIPLANVDRFSKFFHHAIRKKILYVHITKIFNSPAICCYITLRKSKILPNFHVERDN